MLEKLLDKWRELDTVEKFMIIYVAILALYVGYKGAQKLSSVGGDKQYSKGFQAGKRYMFDQLADKWNATKKENKTEGVC